MQSLHCCAGFSLVAENGGLLSSFGAQASHCGGFSSCGAQEQMWCSGLAALRHVAFSRIRNWTPPLHWRGGFSFTTEPKGKPQVMSFYCSRAQARPPHHTTASSCQVSRVPSDMPLLVFHDLDTLEDRVLARLFAKMSLYLDCVVFFSWSDRGYGFGGRIRVTCPYHVSGYSTVK